MLEHHNKEYKLDIRDYKNSTHTILHTSDRVGTLSSILRRFRPGLENAFGTARSSPYHPESHDTIALYSRAVSLLYHSRTSGQPPPSDQQWISDNIFKKSTSMLESKIQGFNNDRKHGTVTADGPDDLEITREAGNFLDYINNSDDSDDDLLD